jgi:uncharacterized protein YmfQ (DUF2313 family)
MAAPLFTVDDYVRALQALLPRGPAWPQDSDAMLTKVLRGLAGVYAYTNQRANNLLVVSFPTTADDMIPEWNETLGLPGLTGYSGSDKPTQRAQIVAALTDTGGQSAGYFIELAAAFGLTITINGYRPYRVRDSVRTPICGPAWAHAWRVFGVFEGDYQPLVILFRLYKPAHTVLIFDVPLGDLLLEDGINFLLTEDGRTIATET